MTQMRQAQYNNAYPFGLQAQNYMCGAQPFCVVRKKVTEKGTKKGKA